MEYEFITVTQKGVIKHSKDESIRNSIDREYVVLINVDQKLLIWQPDLIAFPTKRAEKDYYQELINEINLVNDINGNIVAFGHIRMSHVSDNLYSLNIGDTSVGSIEYTNEFCHEIKQISYKPRFTALSNVKTFL